MRDEEALHGAPREGDAPVRTGPRHAAPRKSLLTKLHIPASKAIALAAMPTAVFVGMGLTPKLAQADELPSNPFAPGPCVTRSEEPEPQKSPSASASESAKPDPTPTAEPSPSASPSAGATKAPQSSSGSSSTAQEDPADSASPSPTPTESKNPFDPLGVGDALGNLLDGGSDSTSTESSATATPEPEPSSSTASATDTAAKTVDTTAETSADTTADKTADTTADTTASDAQATTKEAITKAADKVGATVEAVKDTATSTTSTSTSTDSTTADGKEPYPCPTADPEALANAKQEQGIPLLPDKPWQLESSRLTLRGLDFEGIVEVRTYSGKVKKVLKFTAKETDIKDLHQLVDGPQGTVAHVKAREGSTSTIRDGTVTMYTEKLKGNLFGLIPVTFSPETPPPLNVPVAFFTNVHVVQAGQFGGTLTVPGMHVFNTPD